jgi:hypothetical protein
MRMAQAQGNLAAQDARSGLASQVENEAAKDAYSGG